MEWHPPGLSVCLPLIILPSTIKSRRSFLLALARLGGPGKRAVKWLWWWWYCIIYLWVCPHTYLKNHTSILHKIFFCTCHLWPWLTPPDNNAICYVLPVLWMTSCFHIMEYGAWLWQYIHGRHAAASSHKFPTYSPGSATLFDFVVIYSGRKLHARNEDCCMQFPCCVTVIVTFERHLRTCLSLSTPTSAVP